MSRNYLGEHQPALARNTSNKTVDDVQTTPDAVLVLIQFISIGKTKEINSGIWSGELQTRCYVLAANQRLRAVRL